jgi:hypothetical protein
MSARQPQSRVSDGLPKRVFGRSVKPQNSTELIFVSARVLCAQLRLAHPSEAVHYEDPSSSRLRRELEEGF